VPVVLFVRWAFQGHIWNAPEHSASLIVDDPVLKPRYGFLDFRQVLELMQQHHFSTTIAFIPWNRKRTHKKTASLFLNHPDRYSLVCHGTDHTAGEFGSDSVEMLDRKTREAIARMVEHERLTGIASKPVMVFPQGAFSPEALSVLKSNNFSAAVNTEVNPVGTTKCETEVAELWNMAIMKFSSFPIFTRRYIEHGIENFAFDLLLGKPCLIVAHHDLFKNKAQQLIEFVTSLNSLDCSLCWRGAGDAVRRSYRKRNNTDGTTSIQMFANQMILETPCRTTFHVAKRECNPASVRQVTVDRKTVAWDWSAEAIRFSFEVAAGESPLVTIDYFESPAGSRSADCLSYRIKCGMRRHLSEFRDNYVSRSRVLSRTPDRIRPFLRGS
jgi:hypothetical protein